MQTSAGGERNRPDHFFWTLAGLSAAAGLVFSVRAYFYVPKDYTQE